MNSSQRRRAERASVKAFPDGCRAKVKANGLPGTVHRLKNTWGLTNCRFVYDRGDVIPFTLFRHLERLP